MSHPKGIRAFVAGLAGALAVLAGQARPSHALLPDEFVSYTQPANALVMPFDAGETSESFLTASNVGSVDVSTHWVFWSESCDHLVDVWTCLTRNDTIVVDPRAVQATGPDNEKVGPPADLSGERGFVVVTAYEADSACTAGTPASAPVDDVLVGSYTLADRTIGYAYGNDAIGLGLDETGSYTNLPDFFLDPFLNVQTFDPTTVEASTVILLALEERTGSGGFEHVEVGPLAGVSADVSFIDNLEISTSLPGVSVSCALFTSVLNTQTPSLIPPGTAIASSGAVRLTNIDVGGDPVGITTWLFGLNGQAVDRFGTSSNADYLVPEDFVPPTPTPSPSLSPEPTASPEPTSTPIGPPSPTPAGPTPTAGGPTPTAGGPTPTPGEEPTPTPDGGPTPTPGGGPTPTPGSGPTATPTAAPTAGPTPTAGGGGSCSTVVVRVNLAFTPPLDDVSGMDVKLDYPGPKLLLQGNPSNTSGVSGVFQFGNNDTDTPNDGFEDQLTVGLLAIPGNIPPGQFFTASFACRDGASAPTSGELSCEATGSTLLGSEFVPTCTVSTTVTP